MAGAEEPGEGFRRWRLVRASTDAIPGSVRRFMARARQRRLRAAAPWGLLALVLLALLGLGWLVFASPVLGVQQVEVRGTAIVSPAEVRQAAAVTIGSPMARVDAEGVVRRVGQIPAVGSVEIVRSWPGTLVIKVVERTPVAALARGRNQFDLIDATGVIFHTVPRVPKGVVRVRLTEPGPDDPATRSALTVISALTAELRSRLDLLVVEGPARIRLELRGDRIVTWGDASESELKAKVATALLGRPEKRIDVSAPDVVTLK